MQLLEDRGGLFGSAQHSQSGESHEAFEEIEQDDDDDDDDANEDNSDDEEQLTIEQIGPHPYKLLVGCLLTHVWLVHLELLMAEYLRIEAELSRSIDYWSSYLRDSWLSASPRTGYALQQRGHQSNLTATLHHLWCVFQRGPVYWSDYLFDRTMPSPLEDARRKLATLRESRASLLNQLGFAYLIIHQASTEQDIVGLLQHHLPPGGSLYDRLLQGMALSRREALKFRSIAHRCAKPPLIQRHWLTIATVAIGSCMAYNYAVKRVPRAQQAIEEVKLYVRSFWNEHVMNRASALLATITGQATFQSSVSAESVASSEQSLQRMVVDFYIEKNPKYSEASLAEIRSLSGRGDISFVMSEYEKILREGSFSLLSFSFVRLLLIQVQKQVLEFERALFSMDKLLSANELLFSMLAAVPTILIGYFVPRYLIKTTWRIVTRPASRREVRSNLLECERLLLEADNSLQHLGHVSTLIHRMYCLRHLFSSDEQRNYIQALIELQCLALVPRNRVAKTAAVTRIFRNFQL